jgi:hypothetical protein
MMPSPDLQGDDVRYCRRSRQAPDVQSLLTLGGFEEKFFVFAHEPIIARTHLATLTLSERERITHNEARSLKKHCDSSSSEFKCNVVKKSSPLGVLRIYRGK